jgi:hypothetical protein
LYDSFVRKRIVIGLLVIAAVSVVLALASRPDESSIEYHSKGYFAAGQGRVWDQKLINKAKRMLGQRQRWRPDTNRMEYHKRALIRLGYLDERTVIVSNCPPHIVQRAVYRAAWNSSGWVNVEVRETNKIKIVAMKAELPELEKAAWIADVRGPGN